MAVLLDGLATRDNLSKRGANAHLGDWVEWWPRTTLVVHSSWLRTTSAAGNAIAVKVRKVSVATFFWSIWTHRNNRMFNETLKKEKKIAREVQFMAFEWIRCRSKFGKLLSWEMWVCNLVNAVTSCNILASR